MDYSGLPADILEKLVTQHLNAISHLLSFSGVCKSWRSAALPHCHMHLPGLLISQAAAILPESPAPSRYCGPPHDFLPLITTTMQPITPSPTPTSTKSTRRRRRLPRVMLPHFPSLSQVSHLQREWERHKKIYHGFDDYPYLGSTIQSQLYVASKDGWILIVHPRRCHGVTFYLLNPITKSSIPLPPLPFPSHRSYILKALITSSPDDDSCHVIVLFDSTPQLAWCNVHQAAAAADDATKDDDTMMEGRRSSSAGSWRFTSHDSRIFDIIRYSWLGDMDYLGGKLYVLLDGEYVSVVDGLVSCKLSVRVFPFSQAMSYRSSWSDRDAFGDYQTSYHLANLRGEPLVIMSHSYAWYNPTGPTSEFEVYKLVLRGGGDDYKEGNSKITSYSWEEVTDLDGHAVFLGSHQSFCLAADPLNNGVRGNRIYFVFDSLGCRYYCSNEYGNDCGMFDLGNKRVERFCHRDPSDKMIVERKARTFWFLPMPWDIQKHRKDQERMLEQAKPRPAVDVAKVTKRKSNNNKKQNQQQHDGNKITRLANRFQALLTADDEDHEDEDKE